MGTYLFVKLDFETAVDQHTRTATGDRTFEGSPDPYFQTVPAGQSRPYVVQIRPNTLNISKTQVLGALRLVEHPPPPI